MEEGREVRICFMYSPVDSGNGATIFRQSHAGFDMTAEETNDTDHTICIHKFWGINQKRPSSLLSSLLKGQSSTSYSPLPFSPPAN